jgi:uncharacterized protein
MDNLVLFIILSLIAEILGTIGGFGSSLFFVPIAGFFLDFHSVLGITALFHLSSNLSKIALFKKGIEKKILFQIGAPAVVFVILGAFLSRYVDGKALERWLGVFLIVVSMVLLFFKDFSLKPSLINSVSGGALSGITAGLIGTGGAIRGLTLATFNLEPEIFVATSAFIDLGIDLSRSVIYFSNGFMHKDDLYLIPILLLVGVVGTFIGKKVIQRFTASQFKTSVIIFILVTGIITLWKSW